MKPMRSIISVLILTLTFSLTSCSSDSDSSQTNTLIKKIVQSYDDENFTTTYHYNGSKLDYILMDDAKIVYSYSGNNISAISWQSLTGVENVRNELEYDNEGRLSHLSNLYIGPDIENYVDYTYNDDGTVTEVDHLWDDFEGEYSIETRKLFFFDADLVKIERYLPGGTATIEYSYDDMVNPYHNIMGYDKLLIFDASPHNLISELHAGTDGSVFSHTETTFEYDQAGRPTLGQRIVSGAVMTIQYFY